MKKLLKLVLALAMCATMMSMTAFAAEPGSMTITSATAQAGQTVSIDVSITANPGVAGLVVEPEFDSSVLTLDSITGSGLQWTTGKAASWSDAANTTYTGKIITLNFTVNENAAPGKTAVSVKVEASNFDEELVSFNISSGTVTIECKHVYDQGKVTTAATCEGTGMMTYTCTLGCGDSYTEEIPETGHAYGEWSVTKEATCTEAGTESRVCANDEDHIKTREIPATGHAYGEWSVTKEATCTEAGTESRVCANDNTHVETRDIAATGHDFQWVIDKEATTEETGIKHEECTVCHEKRNEGTVIPKKESEPEGHEHVYGHLGMDEKYHWVYCNCGEIGNKGEHKFADAANGMVRCTECGYETAKSAGNPQTGDNSNLGLWLAFMAVAAGAVSVVVYKKKKQM